MDSTALATFLAVARCGSVTAAALELHTVQSNVTARMKQLEADLGVALLQRHSRGVTLTEAGRRLQVYAERMEALALDARAAVLDDGMPRGSLRIGAMESTAAVRLPQLLGAFHRACPEVQFELRTGPTAELLEQVLGHRLDGAFVAGPLDHPELVGRSVFSEELVLVSARGGAGVGQRLAQGSLTVIVFRQGCSYRQRLETLFTARGWLPFRRLEMGSIGAILACVSGNVGVTLLPRSVVEGSRLGDALQVEAIAPEPLRAETLFVQRRDVYAGTAMQAFEAMLEGSAVAAWPRAA